VPNVEIKIPAEDELTMMRIRNEEDIQSEKIRLQGKSWEVFAEPNREKIENEFYIYLSAFQDIENMEWERAKFHHKLFVDKVVHRSLEILRNPSEYKRLLNE
jgi:hypothetical protein